MKILYLHQYFNTPEMTGGTRSYEMAKRLVARGHAVHMVTSRRDQSARGKWTTELIDGINVHWLPVPYSNHMGFYGRLKAFLHFAWSCTRKARSIDADILFATSTPLTIAIPGVLASRSLGIPMVFEVRDLWPELPIAIKAIRNPAAIFFARKLERFAYRNSTRVIALSPGMADGVIKTGFPRNRVVVIPNSCDLDMFRPGSKDASSFLQQHPELGNSPFILYAGTLGKINGVEYLVKLAAAVLPSRPDLKFVVIGDGMERDLVEATARQLGVLDRNFFLYHPVAKREIVDAFFAASLIVSLCIDLPEMQANSANKFFDGLASGTAVAINYGGWQADLLTSNCAGIVLPPNPEQARSTVLDFFADLKKAAEYGANALRLAEQHFSRDELAQRLEATLIEARRDTY